MAQLGDTIIKGDLNVLGNVYSKSFQPPEGYQIITTIYEPTSDREITTGGITISYSLSPHNYNMILIRLKNAWNYSESWFIHKKDLYRNNTHSICSNDGTRDSVHTQNITDTQMTLYLYESTHGLYFTGIYGLFPIS